MINNPAAKNGLNGNGKKLAKRFGTTDSLKIATWNIRGLNTKEMELIKHIKTKKINIAVITETKKKLKGTKDIENYIMIYSGVEQHQRAACGVAIIIDNKWKKKLDSYRWINERIISLRFKINRGFLTVVGVYAPEEGKKDKTIEFYEQLQKTIDIHPNDHLIIAGDLNARVGNQPIAKIIGTHGEICLNENGRELRDFATFNSLKVTNTFFRKKDINKYTWNARGSRSLIDYIIVNEKLSSQVLDTHVFRGYDLYTDHYLVISKIEIWARWRKSQPQRMKKQEQIYKVYLLENESIRTLYRERLKQINEETIMEEDMEKEWNNIKHIIYNAANEALGKRNKAKKTRGLRIWNEEIEKAITEKQKAYQNFLQRRCDETEKIYKEKRNKAKTIIRTAHQTSWDNFISKIEHDVHGRQSIAYKFLKSMNTKIKDTASINTIPKTKWIEHYKSLWYDSQKEDLDDNDDIDENIDLITMSEFQEALQKLKNRKATGLDNINPELIKYGGHVLHQRILNLLNRCWISCKIPVDWLKTKVISIFKKGERSDCGNYRGISLLNSAYKLYSSIINKRLAKISDNLLQEEQNGFRIGRSCIDSVFILNQLIEKRREFNLETHIAFIDYEKAFDRVDRERLWSILEENGYPLHLIQAIKSLYKGTKILIEVNNSLTEEITINQGVKQGCSLSPTLFNIYIDHLIKTWKLFIPKGVTLDSKTSINTILFADDQAIFQENEDDLQRAIYKLHKLCQTYNMKISIKKTKTMAFRGKEPIRTKIILDNKTIEQVSDFKYLGCDTSYNKNTDLENKLHKFQHICGSLNRILKNKTRKETQLKFYKVMAAPTLLYGSETWTVNTKERSRIQASEMKFLRAVKGCSRMDRLTNDSIRSDLKIYNINHKIIEYQNKWKDHVERMSNDRLPKKLMKYRPIGYRDRGRPMLRWIDQWSRNRLIA